MNRKLVSILKKEGLEHLSNVFLEQGITDSILAELSDGDLRELGIEKLGERKRLLAAFTSEDGAQNEPGAMVEVQGGVLPDGRRVGSFAIGKFAVTMDEWRMVREWALEKGFEMATGRAGGLKHPVTEINWYDAVKWCNAKSEMEGLGIVYTLEGRPYRKGESADVDCNWMMGGYRLPTEAVWEWAARGGVKSCGSVYAGGDNLDAVGWHDGNSGGMCHPVGQKAPNELGLFDMSGNVFEWCWDLEGVVRVLRGGSWNVGAGGCSSAYRGNGSPDARPRTFGFRLALVPSR
jgi:formylglycine-generating enzyme required for sulfatase activity